MQPKLIILGWDGTLVNTTNPIIATLRQSLADRGLPVPEADHIRPLIGYSLPTIVRHLIPDVDGHVQTAVIETYALHYLNPNNHNMKLLDSTVPCLNTLKGQGYLPAVATSKDRTGLDRATGQTGTACLWAVTTYASKQPSKPAPKMVFALCDALSPMPSETLVVGDTTYDLQTTANVKASAVAVATGAHAKVQLAVEPCLVVLNSLAELPVLLVVLRPAAKMPSEIQHIFIRPAY